jgi:aspartate aminotransferase
MPTMLSNRVNQLQPSATLAANDKAKKLAATGVEVINLTVGQPDFPTPDFVKQAAIEAIGNDHSGYTPVDGIPALKQTIIDKFARDNNLSYQADQIIVSSGVKHALYNLTQAILNPGDEAIIPAPYWVSYPSMVQLTGASSVFIDTEIKQNFKITAKQLANAITPKTKLLFLNSPSNPTGSVYSAAELKALGEVLKKHPQVLIVSDDIYEYVYWGEEPYQNIATACPELYQRTIVMNGVAKAQCMPGWRIGYAACTPEIMTGMKKIQSQSTTCATSIAQYAAVAAIGASKEDFFLPMLEQYQQRHRFICAALKSIPGISLTTTEATFYCFIDASGLINRLGLKDDLALCEYILNNCHIATVPGVAFGAPNHLRLSFATNMEQLQKAAEKLTKALR